jgi:hypothetical protein
MFIARQGSVNYLDPEIAVVHASNLFDRQF